MRDPRHIFLTVIFVAFVFGVPMTQGALDIVVDEMPPQVLDLFDLPPASEELSLFGKAVQKLKDIMDGERLRQFEKALEDNSYFEEQGRYGYQVASVLSTGALGEKAIRGDQGWFFYTPGVKYLAEPHYESPRSASFGQQDPIDTIVDFSNQLKERGIDLLVVPVPGKASIYPDRLTTSMEPSPEVYANTLVLREKLEERSIPVFDLHRVLAETRATDSDRQLYMKTDTHWTGEGVRIAARALAAAIREGGWAGERSLAPPYHRERVDVVRRGDVIEMTKIPGRKTLFADEMVQVFQVRDAAGEPYQDDPQSTILWLGDSFSRVFQTDEPGSAGIIANVAYELGMPLASIVNDGGASTLVREQLAKQYELLEGKRLVVWEFIERDIRFGRKGWEKVEIWPIGVGHP
ncbi:hypothetical protein ACFL6C_07410 [Myxococcota bacterium]